MKFNLRSLGFLTTAIIALFAISPLKAFGAGYCGDGALDTSVEQCDDGNFIDRDGCSARCEIEDMTPPTIQSTSIPNNATGVRTNTEFITVAFSEPVNPNTLNTISNLHLEHDAQPMDITFSLSEDGKTLTLTLKTDLFAESSHAIRIKNVKDLAGNSMAEEFISTFTTGTLIDHTPPTVIIDPPGGTYGFPQNLFLTPYLNSYTGSDENRDLTAKIYYTLDGSIPTTSSTLYTVPVPVRTKTTFRFIAVDSVGNRTLVSTHNYVFDCPIFPNAKRVSPYPTCNILECNVGFVLRGNACVVNMDVDPNDYKTNAATAPLFPSATPMSIISKPALFITPAHKGVLPRPINFKDPKRGINIQFERDTKLKDSAGKAFSGYILPPSTLYTKDYPINFGYTFRSIFEFKDAEGKDISFLPSIRITVPYAENFNPDEGVTLFTFNPKTEQYTVYPKKDYTWDLVKKTVTFSAPKTGTFFIAQSGKNFNRAIFKDIDGHWAKNFIEALYRKGIVKGKDDGIFAPNELLTRAEFVKIALKAANIEIPDADGVKRAPFRDSPLDAWFTPCVSKAKELGLITGYSDNSIRPGKSINRAEAIKILVTSFKFDLASNKDPKPTSFARNFRDLPSDAWFTPFIDFALRNKLVDGPKDAKGNPLKTFSPDKPITRAEMSKIAMKAIELKEELSKTTMAW